MSVVEKYANRMTVEHLLGPELVPAIACITVGNMGGDAGNGSYIVQAGGGPVAIVRAGFNARRSERDYSRIETANLTTMSATQLIDVCRNAA